MWRAPLELGSLVDGFSATPCRSPVTGAAGRESSEQDRSDRLSSELITEDVLTGEDCEKENERERERERERGGGGGGENERR